MLKSKRIKSLLANDVTDKVSGTPRVSVLADSDDVRDTRTTSDSNPYTLVVNDGYSVQCTRVSFVPQAYGILMIDLYGQDLSSSLQQVDNNV